MIFVMYNFAPHNVLLSISTNIPVLQVTCVYCLSADAAAHRFVLLSGAAGAAVDPEPASAQSRHPASREKRERRRRRRKNRLRLSSSGARPRDRRREDS